MKKILALIILLALTLSGCSGPSWTLIGGTYAPKDNHYRVNLPQGWMKFNNDRYTLLTRDGVLLQSILIREQNAQMLLPYLKKPLPTAMPVADMAGLTLEDAMANTAHANLQVLENRPITSNNKKGFYLLYSFSNPDGLVYRSAHYGIVGEKSVFHLVYMAPQRHYFNRDFKTFEAVVESFTLQPL